MRKRMISAVLTFVLILALAIPDAASAASKPALSTTKLSLEVGSTKKLSVKNTSQKVTWSSSKKSVATVNSKGTVKGIKAGTAVIKAKVNKTTLKCTVTVTKKVALNSTSVELFSGNQTTLTLKNANSVKWESANAEVATVNSKGVVTAVDKGTTKITATDKKTKKAYTCTVTVSRRNFSLYNNKEETYLYPEGYYSFTMYSIRQYLRVQGDTVSASAVWSSSDESLLAVDADGKKLLAIGFGRVTLTATGKSKKWVYDVDIVAENPYALTYEDFNITNVKKDGDELTVAEGISSNFIDTGKGVVSFILTDENRIIETARGIKLGSTLGEVYAAYGFNYIKKSSLNSSDLNVDGHVATTNMVCHYGMKEQDICYMIAFVFDQNDEVMFINYNSHKYHGQ